MNDNWIVKRRLEKELNVVKWSKWFCRKRQTVPKYENPHIAKSLFSYIIRGHNQYFVSSMALKSEYSLTTAHCQRKTLIFKHKE